MKIRVAEIEDAASLVEIYRPYVEKTAITFEYEVPTVEEYTQRMTQTLKKISLFSARKRTRKDCWLCLCRNL